MNWLKGVTDLMDIKQTLGDGEGRIGKPGMLQSVGSQRVGHKLVTEQQQSVAPAEKNVMFYGLLTATVPPSHSGSSVRVEKHGPKLGL